jgi:hypothetical protein
MKAMRESTFTKKEMKITIPDLLKNQPGELKVLKKVRLNRKLL